MAVTEIICGGVFLSAIGVIGIAISRPGRAEEETPVANKTTANTTTANTALDTKTPESGIEALRARHKVRLVEGKDAGTGVAHLPNGVYGFSFAPQQEAPLFERKMFRNFEVHKLEDGSIHIVGFVTEKESAQLALSNSHSEVSLYPDLFQDSAKAVSVPLDSVARSTGPSRDGGNYLKLEISSAGD